MPPKNKGGKAPAEPSKHRDLVKTGPREVFGKTNFPGKAGASGPRPTTERALILRNGKHGAMGTGEIVLSTKMSGREKLDLLAEDLTKKSAQGFGMPFSLEKCLKIVESQFNANIDEINDLQDPDIFFNKLQAEVYALYPKEPGAKDALRDATIVAQTVSTKIHNTYMFASAWKLIGESLQDLEEAGLEGNAVAARELLGKDPTVRSHYIQLFNFVEKLASASQQRIALLASKARQLRMYFQSLTNSTTNEKDLAFDFSRLREIYKSFIDSIVVEICLPSSYIRREILFMILRDAIVECPNDAKRFPQLMWDAVGDLQTIVELREILEAPLLGPEGEQWLKATYEPIEEYEQWEDAQIFSLKASELYAKFKDQISPPEKTKNPQVLETMWKWINKNYYEKSGELIDDLWHVQEVRGRAPTWHAYKKDSKAKPEKDDSDSDAPPPLKGGKKSRLAITSNGHESDSSMPSLQTVSDSSSAEDDDDSDDDSEEEDDDYDDESAYDTDDEDMFRDQARDAMDFGMATTNLHDPSADTSEFDVLAEERKDNPFIKLLGSLRGRMFPSNPTVKTTSRAEPRVPYQGGKPTPVFPKTGPSASRPPPKPSAKSTKPKPAAQASSSGTQQKSRQATVEDVSDEDAPTSAAKKKKKKPKKKKKKPTAPGEEGTENGSAAPAPAPAEAAAPAPTSPRPPAASAPAPPTTPKKEKKETPKSPSKAAPRSPTVAAQPSVPFAASTASLPLPTEQAPQSARTYLKSEGLLGSLKAKVKTRADKSSLDTVDEKPKKKGIFDRFRKDKTKEDEAEENAEAKKGSAHTFFKGLSKKARTYMHQLLNTSEDEKRGTAPMKWDNFVKLMNEMGFTMDPSTAGSSVRFDPPDPRDKPITFHKPHPDPTLYPWKLKEFSRRLQRRYGWTEEQFYHEVS